MTKHATDTTTRASLTPRSAHKKVSPQGVPRSLPRSSRRGGPREPRSDMLRRAAAATVALVAVLCVVATLAYADDASTASDTYSDTVTTRAGNYTVPGVHQSQSETSVKTFGGAMRVSTIYIDTDYLVSPNTRTLLDFQLTAVKGQYRLFGVEKSATGHLVYSMYVHGQNATSGNFAYARKNDSGNWTGLSGANTARHTFDFNHLTESGSRAVSISGTTTQNRVLTEGSPATYSAQYPLYIGVANSGGSVTAANISPHRIYAAYLFENEAIARATLSHFSQ